MSYFQTSVAEACDTFNLILKPVCHHLKCPHLITWGVSNACCQNIDNRGYVNFILVSPKQSENQHVTVRIRTDEKMDRRTTQLSPISFG